MAENPLQLKEQRTANDGNLIAFTEELASRISTEEANRSNWGQHVDKLHRLRYGIRKKKTKPWEECANFSIPLIDTDISRIKPNYVNVAYGVTPIVSFIPYGVEDVEPMKLREQLFDWRMRTQVDFFKPYCYGIDQILSATGMTVFRIVWEFKTKRYTHTLKLSDLSVDVLNALYDSRVTDEILTKIIFEELHIDDSFEENEQAVAKVVKEFREGKDEFVLDCIEVDENHPVITACDVKEDLVVPIDTKHIQDARFIDYKYWISKNDLRIKMKDGIFNLFADSDIDSWAGTSSNKKRKASLPDEDMVMIHEVCCWYDINNDGIEERCIVEYPDSDTTAILRFIECPYDHGLFPYVQIKRELTRDGFYSTRGIPSLEEDFQEAISESVNHIVDNGTLLNSPERVWRKGILSNPKNRRFVPGEGTEVNGDISQYETRLIGNAAQPLQIQFAQYLKSWTDGLMGNQTSNFSASNQLPGGGLQGKMTAKEVEALIAVQNQAQSLDLLVFQEQMSDVYYMIDALYMQYGNEEEEIMITGQQPKKVSRYEIQGKFDIVPNGKLDNATPQQRLQKINLAIQIGMAAPQVIKPDVLVAEAFKELGVQFERAIKTPQEMAQEAQMQAQAIAQKQSEEAQGAIQSRVISDNLDVRKEILLTPIQGRKYAAE